MTYENIGCTIQKIIQNTPVSVSANSYTTTVATSGGDVYMAGFIGNKIQHCFEDVVYNNDIVGHVVETRSGDYKVWLLNDHGSVYEFDYNKNDCEQRFREIYSPRDCCGDKAKKIASGRDHVVILTEKNRIYGAGDNNEYQLVPQGQCNYDCATEILIADTNVHDDCCCNQFAGFYNPLSNPVIPGRGCGKSFCSSNYVPCYNAATMTFSDVDLVLNTGASIKKLTLSIPIFINYKTITNACVDAYGNISGNIQATITNLFIGSCVCPDTNLPINSNATLSGTALPSSPISIPLPYIKFSVGDTFTIPIPQGTTCNPLDPNANIEIVTSISLTPSTSHSGYYKITLTISEKINNNYVPINNNITTDIYVSNTSTISFLDPVIGNIYDIPFTLGTLQYSSSPVLPTFNIPNIFLPIECCGLNSNNCCNKEVQDCCPLPQPCWKSVYAGFDNTVLVDSCNKLYVLGNLHRIRSNKHLLRKNCLEELLDKTNATITLPADQLNCCVRPRSGSCRCSKCKDKCFKTDLSKFGVQLNFANNYCLEDNSTNCECQDGTLIRTLKNRTNVCDFLKALQNCNEYPTCDDTCEPCESTIYLNVCGGNCGCTCGNVQLSAIGSITLYNKKSVCRYVSQSTMTCINNIGIPCNQSSVMMSGPSTSGCFNTANVSVNLYSLIEWDLNKYCIDSKDIPLDQIVVLQVNTGSDTNIAVYVDTCKHGAIKLVSCSLPCPGPTYDYERYNNKRYDFDFPLVDQSSSPATFALTYSKILDPVELTNFKLTLGLTCGFPSSCYRNPLPNKLISTYLRGGDRVRFYILSSTTSSCDSPYSNNIRLPITADVPTVFNFRKRVLDIAVGNKNLSVLIGDTKCPNEVYALGENCNGELGINGTYGITNNETVLCFHKLNRCLFDCQVEKLFSGKGVTFYITQSYRVYSSGSWKCLDQSNIPICVPSICQAWKIIYVSVARNHVVLLGKDGCIFGFGDNNLGELGLCHTHCVKKPVPLVFFYRLNQCAAKKFYENFKHPILKYYDGKCCNVCYFNPCKCVPCEPCSPVCEYDEKCKRKRKCRDKFEYVEEYKIKCESCGYDPCRCGVKYIKYGHKKYSANSRCFRK